MRYNKGTFVVVPNVQQLKGKDPTLQCLYMWLCKYANEDGICYPSINKLSDDVGVSRDTIIRKTKDLEDLGLLIKTTRFVDGTQATSEYTIHIFNEMGVAINDPGVANSDTELYQVIIIEKKTDILEMLGEEKVQQYKNQIICLWYMIELGYELEKSVDKIMYEIEWIKEKADIYGYRMVDGGYDWNTIKQKFDRWYNFHKEKGDKIERYKSSVLQFLDPNSKMKGKQKR